jgi:hypothetical protein
VDGTKDCSLSLGQKRTDYTLDICNNDDSVYDSDGDSCSDIYDGNPQYCGGYNTDEFVARYACCDCGGGIFDYYKDRRNDDILASFVFTYGEGARFGIGALGSLLGLSIVALHF